MFKKFLILIVHIGLLSTIDANPVESNGKYHQFIFISYTLFSFQFLIDGLLSDSLLHKFKENYLKVETHNKRQEEITFETNLNEFSGLSHDEFMAKFLSKDLNQSAIVDLPGDQLEPTMQNDYTQLPNRFDWRDYGMVTPVRHQGSCGTCWSFTNTGAVETLYANKYGQLVELSEQEINDCLRTGSFKNWGCNGGWPHNGFYYAMNTGLVAERDSPYLQKDAYCPSNRNMKRYKIRGYSKISYGDEQEMKRVVATYGPIAVAIDASDWGFAYYSKGVYTSRTCKKNVHNHAVLVVGYGTENGLDYWLIKNSWGTNWGEVCFFC